MGALFDQDRFYMSIAISIARMSAEWGEVPVGCVIVQNGRIIAMATNEIVQKSHPLLHAERLALDRAHLAQSGLRLQNTTLYATLEPCAMCAGAILLARVERVVIGAMDEKRGCTGSVYQLLDDPAFNHKAKLMVGVHKEEASRMLSSFFLALRERKKAQRAEFSVRLGISKEE